MGEHKECLHHYIHVRILLTIVTCTRSIHKLELKPPALNSHKIDTKCKYMYMYMYIYMWLHHKNVARCGKHKEVLLQIAPDSQFF